MTRIANTNFKIYNEAAYNPVPYSQDFTDRYVTKDYLIDVYPGIASVTGARSTPGLWTMGGNQYGEIGNGTNNINYSSPVQVGSLTNWKQISSGAWCFLALKTDGTIWTWGYGAYGQLGNGTVNINYSSPIQIGALTTWRRVSMGTANGCAVKTDGTLWVWGNGSYGQLGNGSTTTSVSSPIPVGALTNWKQVEMGGYHVIAAKNDGTLWGWGYNNFGEVGNSTSLNNISTPVQIGTRTDWRLVSASFYGYHSAAIRNDGTLWIWGYNAYAQLGNGTFTYYSSPIQVGSSTDWKQVACGYRHTMAIKNDGTLWGWGHSIYGAVGNGSSGYVSTPVQVGTLTNWNFVSSGEFHTMAVKTDGTLWGWGYNYEGELGNNPPANNIVYSPIQIGTQTKWKRCVAGFRGSAAIADGYF